MVLQHIWLNYLQFQPQYQNYQELIEKIKLTPRIWNPAVKLNELLKYITWILGISVNLIGLKRTQVHHNETFQCHHTKLCFLPYFKFQNPCIRFCQKPAPNFFQLNFLEFKSEFFSIAPQSCSPILINQLANFDFHYKSEPVTLHDIDAILKQQPLEKSFSIALYSTSSFVRSNHVKVISEHIVGHLKNDSATILHLFLTPHLHDPSFDVYVLDFSTNNITFNQKNVYCNTHITEGKYLFNNRFQPNKEILNQEHCICEHPDTERYHAPNNKSFKPLGESLYLHRNNKQNHGDPLTTFIIFTALGANQKNFLYENLGGIFFVFKVFS